MFWFYVTVGFLVIISVWGAIDWVMEVRKKRRGTGRRESGLKNFVGLYVTEKMLTE